MTTRPTAAPVRYLYTEGHRTMAEVMADEALGCRCNLPRLYGHRRHPGCRLYDRTRYERERRSVRTLVEP